MKQDDIFLNSEGDNWFLRNKSQLEGKEDDLIIDFLSPFDLFNNKLKVLEVGSSNGHRLNKIYQKFGSECFGLDASEEAIKSGKESFPNITLVKGGADKLPYEDDSFDLVIINFVLHWIDRKNLLRVISELDRVIKNQGLLLIGDFYPGIPEKRGYHHLKDGNVFTYKQPYHEVFTSSNIYEIIEFITFHHSEKTKSLKIEPRDRCSLSLLKKMGSDCYVSK